MAVAELRDRLAHPRNFTIEDDDLALEKGAFVKLSDDRTISGGTLLSQPCAGIVAREKIAGDGRTQVAVFRNGIFDALASGAILDGEALQMAADGYIQSGAVGTTINSGAVWIGHAIQAGADAERIQFQLELE